MFDKVLARTEGPVEDLRSSTTNLIQQTQQLYGYQTTSPLAKMPAMQASVMLDLGTVAHIVNPIVAKVMARFLQDSAQSQDGSEASDVVGIAALTALKSLMASNFSAEVLERMSVPLSMQNVYFTLEKFSDDFGKFNTFTNQFAYPHIVSAFEQASLMILCEGSDLDSALQHMLSSIGTTAGIDTEINAVIAGLKAKAPAEQLAALDAYAPGFTTDPNIYFLTMNLVALYLLYQEFVQIRDNPANIGFAGMAQKGIDGLTNRYVATGKIMQNPSMPITKAIELGKYSILTDTFAGYFAIAANADTENEAIRAQLEQNQDLAMDAVDEASYLIRMLNDAGSAAEQSESAIAEIDQLRDLLGRELSPRDLFTKLDQTTVDMIATDDVALMQTKLKFWKDKFSRFIKDATEAEYNTVLNSGMTMGAIEENWITFETNLRYLGSQFRKHLTRFRHCITELNRLAPAVAEFLGRFVFFNHELYGLLGGDYDRSNVPWNKLASMADRTGESWQAEYLIWEEETENLPETES
jgi:hypothetical protein